MELSNSPGSAQYPSVVADRVGNIHVLWIDRPSPAGQVGEDPSGTALFYRRWNAASQSWTDPSDVLADGSYARATLGINSTDDTIHAVWSAWPRLRHSSAAIGGQPENARSWSSAVTIDDQTNEGASQPDIVVDDQGVLHVVWMARPLDNTPSDIRYSRSFDNGASWDPSVKIGQTPNWSGDPRISTAPSGILYAAWQDGADENANDAVYFTLSRNGGATWETPAQLNSYRAAYPNVLAVDGSKVVVAWIALDAGVGKPGRELIISSDGGNSWGASVPFPRAGADYSSSYRPADLALDGDGRIHAVYFDRYGQGQMFLQHAVWTPAGWTEMSPLAEVRQLEHVRPRIAVALGNQIHVAWAGGASSNTYQIYWVQGRANASSTAAAPARASSAVATPTRAAEMSPAPDSAFGQPESTATAVEETAALASSPASATSQVTPILWAVVTSSLTIGVVFALAYRKNHRR